MAKPTLQRTNSSPKDSAPIPDSPTKESSNSVNLKDSAPLQPVISPRIKGIRSRIQRFTSSWFSVTMVSRF